MLILAIDAGTTHSRAALLTETGEMDDLVTAPGPSARTADDGSHQFDVVAWWDDLHHSIERLTRGKTVAAVAATGMTRTQILLDKELCPVHPAIGWADSRADDVTTLAPLFGDAAEVEALNPFHPAARLWHLWRTRPDVLAAAARVCEPKDFINAKLTGTIATDWISSARLKAASDALAAAACHVEGVAATMALVPPMMAPTDVLGTVQCDGLPALQGAKVAVSSFDTWCAVAGLGALGVGKAYNVAGTTEVVGAFADHPVTAKGLMAVTWGEGLHQLGGPSQCGGGTLDWARDALNLDPSSATIGPAPLFIPYLNGERVPHWDPDRRGAFIGLSDGHDGPALAYSVLEGLAFHTRLILAKIEAAGLAVDAVRMGGGLAHAGDGQVSAVKATAWQRPVIIPSCEEPGLLGAAMVASVAMGRDASLAKAQERMGAAATTIDPDRRFKAFVDRRFEAFCAADAALQPLSAALVADGHLVAPPNP
ncbi:MAG: FGGY-family carbohydrate kinase [Pseudomonadota bacterium]